jgi:hypothetical protein
MARTTGVDRLAIDPHAAGCAGALDHTVDDADAQHAPAGPRGVEQGRGEARGVNLRGRLDGPERGGDDAGAIDPGRPGRAMTAGHASALARGQLEGVHARRR